MQTRIIVMLPTGERSEMSLDLPFDPGFVRLQEIVAPQLGGKGSRMERVAVLFEGKPCDMFVDENGHSRGLPPNAQATAVYHNATKTRGESTKDAPIVVGPAVLFTRKVWF